MKKILFTFCFLSLLLTALAQQTQRRTGSISGRIVAEDGAAVTGARVFIGALGERTGSAMRNITVDENGSFTANNLEARSYRVSASIPGYVTAGEDEPWRIARIGDTVTVMLTKGGVITGRVTDQHSELVIGITVQAIRVKDGAGKPLTVGSGTAGSSVTDDRGIYRVYGLPAGSYLVSTSAVFNTFSGSPYLGTSPTFYPSNTREGATEVQVTPGSEANGVDIRYRGDFGHSVSGKVSGAIPTGAASTATAMLRGVSVRLTAPGTNYILAQSFVQTGRDQFTFELKGVSSGEYEISAQSTSPDGITAISPPRRVTVRNADVSGLDLVLATLGSLSGKIAIEPAAGLKPEEQVLCVKGRPAGLNEIALGAQFVTPRKDRSMPMSFGDTAPSEDGAFTLSALEAGQYRLQFNLPGESWYVKSIAPPAGKTAANGFTLAAGEKLSGVIATLTEGAAQIRGKWAGKSNTKMRVYLVPADVAQANDVLRYYEAPIQADGSFNLTHLAPGKYWFAIKAAQPLTEGERMIRPLAWDTMMRAALRKEAEAAAQSVELTPCMRLSDYKLAIK